MRISLIANKAQTRLKTSVAWTVGKTRDVALSPVRLAQSLVAQARRESAAAAQSFNLAVDRSVCRALASLGVATRLDVETIKADISRLHDSLSALK